MKDAYLLASFAHEAAAKLLVNVLNEKDLVAKYHFNTEHNAHLVLTTDIHQFPEAKKITEEFLENPSEQKYQELAWQMGDDSVSWSAPKFDVAKAGKTFFSVPVTAAVLLACLLVYLLATLNGPSSIFRYLHFLPISELFGQGEWWRLMTPALFHFSVMHIVFNLLWWWVLGRPLETKFGSLFLLSFFLLVACISNYAQFLASSEFGQYLVAGFRFGGLSGVVYGLFGFVWWLGWLRPDYGIGLPKPLVGFLLIWLVLGYADVLWVNMANTAHTSGLILGCLGALLVSKLDLEHKTSDKTQ